MLEPEKVTGRFFTNVTVKSAFCSTAIPALTPPLYTRLADQIVQGAQGVIGGTGEVAGGSMGATGANGRGASNIRTARGKAPSG